MSWLERNSQDQPTPPPAQIAAVLAAMFTCRITTPPAPTAPQQPSTTLRNSIPRWSTKYSSIPRAISSSNSSTSSSSSICIRPAQVTTCRWRRRVVASIITITCSMVTGIMPTITVGRWSSPGVVWELAWDLEPPAWSCSTSNSSNSNRICTRRTPSGTAEMSSSERELSRRKYFLPGDVDSLGCGFSWELCADRK